jgi:adenylyltransferase/sulfurtransferase
MILLSATEINKRLQNNENITIIDIREPYEVEVCSIGCINIPMASVVDQINNLKSFDNIALMCRSGKRAESVANFLEKDYQFSDIIVMEGGIVQWKEQVDSSLRLDE